MKSSLLERISRFLLPSWFYAGLSIGIALSILAGHWASKQNTFGNHSRFFLKISPQGDIYPTLNNLLEFVRHKAPKDKTLVLVGGSSKFLGVGQYNDHLWTQKLQEELGPDFAVVNVAFRGSFFTTITVPLMEILSKEYPNWYLVGDFHLYNPAGWLFVGKGSNYPYRYVLWQARLSGKWTPNPTVDAELKHVLFSQDPETRLFAQEELLRAIFEKATHASDLWNYIGYFHFFPIYTNLLQPGVPFWKPRVEIEDNEVGDRLPSPQRHEKILENQMGVLHSLVGSETANSPSRSETVSKQMIEHIDALGNIFPEEYQRNRSLLCQIAVCPFYLEHLKPADRDIYINSNLRNIEALKSKGYNAINIGEDFKSEDYVDLLHFSNSAAPRIAGEVASALLEMDQKNRAINSK